MRDAHADMRVSRLASELACLNTRRIDAGDMGQLGREV
jgi:hypothetical protein